MTHLMWRVLRDRWHLLVGTLCVIALGVGLVHSGLAIATTIASARPPADLGAAERAAYLTRLNGTNTLNGIASMLGIFLTVFVVRSTIDFAVTQRRRELALLRLVGVKRGQLRRMLLGEAVILGLAGTLIGAVLGLVLAMVQRGLYVRMGVMPADVVVGWQPLHLVFDALVGVGVAVGGAAAASRRATKVTPLDGLGGRGEEARLLSRSRWVWGVLAAIATAAQLAASLAMGGFLGPLVMGLGIVVTGSITASQFAPVLVPATAVLVQKFARGPVSQLAVATVRDDARRTAQIAAPLIVLVSLVAGLQGLLDTQTATGNRELVTTTRADLLVETHGDPSRRIAAVDGVGTADVQVQVPASITLGQGKGSRQLTGPVWALDPERFAHMHPYRPVQGDLAAFDERSIVIGPGVENSSSAPGGGTVAVSLAGVRQQLTVAARTGEGLAATDSAYIPLAIVPDDLLAKAPSTVLVTVEEGVPVTQVSKAISALGLGAVSAHSDRLAEHDATKDGENRAVMTALVGVGSLYALISLLSTLAIATVQRRSEFAVDRLTGLTRSQVTAATILETLTTITIGMFLGGGVSVLALVGLWTSSARSFGSPVIAIPWTLLAGMALLVSALACATTWVAVRAATSNSPVHDLITKE
ncbi:MULTISPECIES: FtsX-like permease family protein [unclassified Luteococcus]|uniref:FtsX-like permease family protein n=1 Tax=unclassified Luteococcus TaxID=2639923 RepID=UPI00313C9A40